MMIVLIAIIACILFYMHCYTIMRRNHLVCMQFAPVLLHIGGTCCHKIIHALWILKDTNFDSHAA